MNYKHLYYFWTVVRCGGVIRAAEQLNLTPQTLSGQIGLLQQRLGRDLLRKVGRGVEPTEAGRLVMHYADEIFTLGAEIEDALREGRAQPRAPVLRIGIVDSVPKTVGYHVVEPAIRLNPAPRLVCGEGKLAPLLGQLAMRQLDLIVSDVPLPGSSGVKAYAHLLGRSGIAFFGAPRLLEKEGLSLRQARAGFADALARLPVLMPGPESGLRPRIDAYFRGLGVQPRVAGEFDDGALLKAFGREGLGLFPAPAVLAKEISRQFEVDVMATPPDLGEEFYAISIERRITHPAVAAITAAARTELFGRPQR